LPSSRGRFQFGFLSNPTTEYNSENQEKTLSFALSKTQEIHSSGCKSRRKHLDFAGKSFTAGGCSLPLACLGNKNPACTSHTSRACGVDVHRCVLPRSVSFRDERGLLSRLSFLGSGQAVPHGGTKPTQIKSQHFPRREEFPAQKWAERLISVANIAHLSA
jgi:hypothetical protein